MGPTWIAALFLLACSVVLLLHHRWKHRTGGADPLPPENCNQWFQISHVTLQNLQGCSFQHHETWILMLLAVAAFLAVFSYATGLP